MDGMVHQLQAAFEWHGPDRPAGGPAVAVDIEVRAPPWFVPSPTTMNELWREEGPSFAARAQAFDQVLVLSFHRV